MRLRSGSVLATTLLAVVLWTVRLPAVDFLRGDANGDGVMTIADSHAILMRLYQGTILSDCAGAQDPNFDDRRNLADGIWVLNTLFRGGPPPLEPFPEVGPAPEGAELGCKEYGGGSPLEDPLASLVVLDAASTEGNGQVAITIGASNATPVAGYTFQVKLPDGSIAGNRERLDDLTGDWVPFSGNGSFNVLRRRDDVLSGAMVFSLSDRVAFAPSADVVPIAEAVLCLEPGTLAGEYPLTLLEAEFIDSESSRSIYPTTIDGVLRVEEDVSVSGDCSTPDLTPEPDPGRPQEPIGPTARANNVTFRLEDRAVLPGATVDVPFYIRADGGIQGYSFSVDFDEDVLTATAVEPAWEIPGGYEYSFGVFEYNNENDVPGNSGVDEGVVVGAAIFDSTIHVAIPANEDVEAVRIHFDVAPDAEDAVTHIRFADGGQGSGEPLRNAVTTGGETLTPEFLESFVKVDCTLVLEANVDIATFRRGDVNADQQIDLTDAQYSLNFLFLGGPRPVCFDAMDANDDGKLDISDGLRILHYLFLGSASLPPPFTEEGEDPTLDSMTCARRDA